MVIVLFILFPADSGTLQLQMMTEKAFARLVRDTLPAEWSARGDRCSITWHPGQPKEPPVGWIESIWNYLRSIRPKSLEKFNDLPLIQVEEKPEEVVLAFLKKNSPCLAKKHGSDAVKENEVKTLQQIGIIVCTCPAFIDSARLVAEGYLRIPSPKGVVAALVSIPNKRHLKTSIEILPEKEKNMILSFLARSTLTETEKKTIRDLPLFKTRPSTTAPQSKFVAANTKMVAFAPLVTDSLPQALILEYDLICCTDQGVLSLLSNLGVKQKSRKDILNDMINAIATGLYDDNALFHVSLWILQNFKSIKQEAPQSLWKLKCNPFVRTLPGHVKSPCELYDPTDAILAALLPSEYFPADFYTQEHLLPVLREIGLLKRANVSTTELSVVVESITRAQDIQKAEALATFLTLFPNKLVEHYEGREFLQFMLNMKCLPVLHQAPPSYPKQLRWHGENETLTSVGATAISTDMNMLVGGGSVPFLTENVSLELQRRLGIKESFDKSHVIRQLELCSELVVSCGDPTSNKELENVTHAVYQLLRSVEESVIDSFRMRVPKCIWNGETFVEIERVTLSYQANDFHPYLSSVPKEYAKYKDVFIALGVQESLNPSQLVDIVNQIQQGEPKHGSTDDRREFRNLNVPLVNKILTKLTDTFTGGLEDVIKKLLVPTNRREYLELVKPENCAFLDSGTKPRSCFATQEFARLSGNIFLIDDGLPIGTANKLGIQPLSMRILDADELSGIEQAGQNEPLTTRIKNIIKNSYLDSTIPKEMIQNAEDAHATQVHFLLDLRNNRDARSSLFDQGMSECQGPALWVYNDARFTQEDFENITKLGGATKEQDTSKIGRFGLGFNAVYNLTDVPSFISGQFLQIFDPHTTHLGSMIKNPASPGIRVDLQRNTKMFSLFKDQFAPYNDVFDCCLEEEEVGACFDGTLFRLPFRTRDGSRRSLISEEFYDENKIKTLIAGLWQSTDHLLVFTKYVKKISVSVLSDGKSPSEAQTLFTVDKHSVGNVDDRDILAEFSQHKRAKRALQKIEPVMKHEELTREMTSVGRHFLEEQVNTGESMSCISISCIGTGTSYGMWKTRKRQRSGLAPCGGVAVTLPLQGMADGKLFCGLPLSVPESQLPFHINGFFAISSDRRNLWKSSIDAEDNHFTRWNHCVFEDIICRAYILLLSSEVFQKHVVNSGILGVNTCTASFYGLWPDARRIVKNSDCCAIIESFYREVLGCNESSVHPVVFWEGQERWSFKKAVFIDPVLEKDDRVAQAVRFVLRQQCRNQVLTELPKQKRDTFSMLHLSDHIERQTYSARKFFEKIFVPKISSFPGHVRNPLVHYCLERDELSDLLWNVACIPSSPTGETVKKPSDLIHPHGRAAALFSDKHGRFPHGAFEDPHCLLQLDKLGMVKDDISTKDYLHLAEELSRFPESNTNSNYDRRFLEYLVYMIMSENYSWMNETEFCQSLRRIAFLPTTTKGIRTRRASRDTIHVQRVTNIVGEVAIVLDESNVWIPNKVKKFLGIVFYPHVSVVLKNLEEVIKKENSTNIQKICEEMYEYLDWKVMDAPASGHGGIREFFSTKKCILVKEAFVRLDQVAKEFEEESIDPYLFRLPHCMLRCKHLLSTIKVREHFTLECFASALKKIHSEHNGQLDSETFDQTMKLIRCFVKRIGEDPLEKHDLRPELVFLPDSECVMRPANELSCGVDWISDASIGPITHKDIPPSWTKKLGVKDIRQHILEKFYAPIPGLVRVGNVNSDKIKQFGQREILTNRIKNILRGYPCDEAILKELVQNADDAQASEIHLVLDQRNHPTDRLLGDGMTELQGPALCVYNNKPFTNEDIEGIQRLGEGSKTNNASRVGRFGVGFNAVYHLTDCPTFLTNGDTLCMFDPNVKYVPNATEAYPGFMAEQIGAELKEKFPDVFNCYLPDHFQPENSTMFRLPLRTEQMAVVSQISSTVMDTYRLQGLMEKFKSGVPEMLLFLNHVRKVSLSTIDQDGNLNNTYTVQVSVSDSSRDDLHKFISTISTHEKKVTSLADEEQTRCLESDFQFVDVHYELNVTVTETLSTLKTLSSEQWLIHQQHGFKKRNEIPPKVQRAYEKGDLKVLPVGGVAVCLSRQGTASKAYCFLPLPITTGLPVHVNGYFELDHELRRNLWDERDDARGQWNQVVLKQIIAPSYVAALQKMHDKLTVDFQMATSIDQIEDGIKNYIATFPSHVESDLWKMLMREVYNIIAKNPVPLFPIVRHRWILQGNSECPQSMPSAALEWGTPIVGSNNPGYFDWPIRHDTRLRALISELGFPLIECPFQVQNAFTESILDNNDGNAKSLILEITPEELLIYLGSDAAGEVSLATRQLPRPITDTVMRDKYRLKLLLKYCSESVCFRDKLEKTPLLFTSDGKLRSFSTLKPVFKTTYNFLLPTSNDEFLDPSQHEYFDDEFDVLATFDIPAFASRLRKELPSQFGSNKFVKWDRSTPSESWIAGCWKFLGEIGNQEALLQHLDTWSLLPCRTTGNTGEICYLVSLSNASKVMKKLSNNTSDLHTVLRSLNVCEVDRELFTSSSGSQLMTDLVASEEQPERILSVFGRVMQTITEMQIKLISKHSDTILRYFSQHRSEKLFTGENRRIIMALPCHKQLDGTTISLTSASKVYLVKKGLPLAEMGKWKVNHTFLVDDPVVHTLYQALGCLSITECKVYSQFIFPNFRKLSEDSRLSHLQYVKSLLVGTYGEEEQQIMKYVGLRTHPLLTDVDGNLRPAGDFFDYEHSIFQTMLPESKFPSPNERKLGILFLRKMGIQTKVTKPMFTEYATTLATLACDVKDENRTAAVKSYKLVHELLENCALHDDESFLAKIKSIRFIVPKQPDEELHQIHPFHNEKDGKIRFEQSIRQEHKHLVWTSQNILPDILSCITHWEPCRHEKERILASLGVASKPNVESVIRNAENVCNSASSALLSTSSPVKSVNIDVLAEVLDKTYEYLESACETRNQTRCNSPKESCNVCQLAHQRLSVVPCILIRHAKALVKPSRVCRGFEVGDLFQPHLYQLPDALVPKSKLFQCLGATKSPSLTQLATVLNELASLGGKNMSKNPNIKKAVVKASEAFFIRIEDMMTGTQSVKSDLQEELRRVQSIHLPTSPHCKLVLSTQTFIEDNTGIAKRAMSAVSFVLDEVINKTKDGLVVIGAMPDNIRPRLISKSVTEQLDDKEQVCPYENAGHCEYGARMKEIIKSREFNIAVERMVCQGDDKTIHHAVQSLKKVQVRCFSRLSTILMIEGREIDGSRTDSLSFLTTDRENVILHVHHTTDSERGAYMKAVKAIAMCISNLVGGIKPDHLSVLEDVLYVESPRDIPSILRRHKMEMQEAKMKEEAKSLPKLGSKVPRDILHLLEQNPYVRFFSGEFVAYQIESDQQVNEIPIHVYAQVVEVPDSWLPPLHNQYMIDIGEKSTILVSELTLFKFLIPSEDAENEEEMALLIYSHSREGEESRQAPSAPEPYPEAFEDAKLEVTSQLDEIWKLDDENLRKKAIRRLLLRWHPDKNPNRQALATKVFQFLQSEIERLKSGRGRAQERESRGRESDSFFDDDFFEFMRNWGREDGRRSQSYRQQFRAHRHSRSSGASYCPPSFDDTPEPDMPKAKIWFRQAEMDYESATNDLNPSGARQGAYDWTCFKCYHATEKALKAAQLATLGKTFPSHNINVLLEDLSSNRFHNAVVIKSVHQVSKVVGDETCLYPVTSILSSKAPCERYCRSDAEKAIEHAGKVLIEIKHSFNF